MNIRPIGTDRFKREALQEIERLWRFPDHGPNATSSCARGLVEAYEKSAFDAA